MEAATERRMHRAVADSKQTRGGWFGPFGLGIIDVTVDDENKRTYVAMLSLGFGVLQLSFTRSVD